MDPRNFISFAYDYADGKNPAVPIEKLLTRPRPPVAEDRKWIHLDNVESHLFRSLSESEREFALLNPSWGTLKRASAYVCAVHISRKSPIYDEMTEHIRKNCNLRVRIIPQDLIKDFVCYLGSNRPEQIPDYVDKYVVAIADPYQMSSIYSDWTVESIPEGKILKYLKVTKKNFKHQQESYLYDTPDAYMYPPPAVSAWIGQRSAFFLESSEFFPMGGGKDQLRPTRPLYLDRLPDLGVLGDKEVRLHGKKVYDVAPFVGSYLSRRRWQPPEGYEWVELAKTGVVPITVYTTNLRVDKFLMLHEVTHRGRTEVIISHSHYPVQFVDDVEKLGMTTNRRKKWERQVRFGKNPQDLVMGRSKNPVPIQFAFLCPGGYAYFGTERQLRGYGIKDISPQWYYTRKRNVFYDDRDVFDRGFFFVDDPNGNHVTSFGPKGICYKAETLEVGVTHCVILRQYQDLARNFFPTVEDFQTFYSMSPCSLTRWTQGEYFRPIDTDARYQSRHALETKARMLDVLSNEVVSDLFTARGKTKNEITSLLTNEDTVGSVTSALMKEKDFFRISFEDENRSRWCLKRNCSHVFSSENTDLSGMKMSEVLKKIDENRSLQLTFDERASDHLLFIRMLSHNLYRVYVSISYPPRFRVKMI